MTNFNSGFNPNFNPNINPNPNPNINPSLNPNNTQNQGFNHINPYINTLKQPLTQQNITNSNKTPKQQNNSEQVENKNLVLSYDKVKMDSEALLKYLQNIMKMPENLDKLLTTVNSPIIKALIKNNIDTEILAEIMKDNSSKAVEKVLKAISESLRSGIKDVSQLKDVLGILNTIQNVTSNNVIKELLLLYIPVNPPIFDKNIEFSTGNPEEESAIKNSEFCLIFETVNFSNISCCMNNIENTIYLQIFSNKIFPFERFKKVIDNFKKEMNLRVESENKHIKRAEENKTETRNFNIISNGYISYNILILAHLIIKTVFKIDEMFESQS